MPFGQWVTPRSNRLLARNNLASMVKIIGDGLLLKKCCALKNLLIETFLSPTGLNDNLLKSLKYTLPTTIVRKKVKVVTRKKLKNNHK